MTGLSSEERFVEHLGIRRGSERPVVFVEGRAQEGAMAVADEYAAFVERLRGRMSGRVAETLDMAIQTWNAPDIDERMVITSNKSSITAPRILMLAMVTKSARADMTLRGGQVGLGDVLAVLYTLN